MNISIFQALTILADKYQSFEGGTNGNLIFNNIKQIFLMGIENENDAIILSDLLKDEALKNYEFSLVTEDDFALLRRDFELLSEDEQQGYNIAKEKLEVINNDPSRRYFESVLCHDTLRDSIDELDIELLQSHFDIVFSELSFMKRRGVQTYIYDSDDVNNIISKFSSTAPEYVTATSKLKNPNNFPSFRDPAVNNETEEDIAKKDEALKARAEKMLLLAKTAHSAMSAVHTAPTDAYPLNIYGSENSPFLAIRRGRVDRIDQDGNKQVVKSNNLGIMRSYMPLPRDSELYEEPTMATANQYLRPADMTTFIEGADLPQTFFSSQVTPFSNSISGTMLCQLRVMAKLIAKNKFKYADNPQQFKSFMKNYISYMIYNAGGHSLGEFTSVWQLPEVQQAFKDIPGIKDLNMRQLFQTENDASFMSALDKTIIYNNKLLHKQELHIELKKLAQTSEQVIALTPIEITIRDNCVRYNHGSETEKENSEFYLLNNKDAIAYYKAKYCDDNGYVKFKYGIDKDGFITYKYQKFSKGLMPRILNEHLLNDEFIHRDELATNIKSKLRPFSKVKLSIQQRVGQAIDCLMMDDSIEDDLSQAAILIIKQINASKRIQNSNFESIDTNLHNVGEVKKLFTLLKKHDFDYLKNMSEKDIDIDILNFIDSLIKEKERQYSEANLDAPSLASRLDRAWAVYNDESKSVIDRQVAKEFLTYILDIDDKLINLGTVLEAAMNLRETAKTHNIDFIPGHSPLPIKIDNASLARQLDDMWLLYQDDKANDTDRLKAQELLIFILSINNPNKKLNQQFSAAMALRESLKVDYPDFIPGRSSLPEDAINAELLALISKTKIFKKTKNLTIKSLFDKQEILDVKTASKIKDQGGKNKKGKKTIYYNILERDVFRVDIYKGLFMRKKKPFNTFGSTSHAKENFASFTLDVNGELSIFEHINHDKTGVAHSSMNSGKPVICAGEVEIIDGMLKTITTYSGHYRPTLFNIYKTLDYFSERGVDVSETKLLSFKDPAKTLDINSKRSKEYPKFYESNAQDLLHSYKGSLRKDLKSIKYNLEKYKSSRSGLWYKIFHKTELTNQKIILATSLIDYISQQSKVLSKMSDVDSYQKLLVDMANKVDEFNKENIDLSARYNRSEGGFAHSMAFFNKTVDSRQEFIHEAKEQGVLEDSSQDCEVLKDIGRNQK